MVSFSISRQVDNVMGNKNGFFIVCSSLPFLWGDGGQKIEIETKANQG